jgi:hypothetical protein
MSDLFDAEQTPAKPQRRTSRSVPGGAASEASVAPLSPAAEDSPDERLGDEALMISDHDARNAMQIELTQGAKAAKGDGRLLTEEKRLTLSKIVDHRISAWKRHRIEAHDVRQVILEVIANI